MIDYTLILDLKYKGNSWGLNANDPNQLTWSESNPIPKPTKEQLDAQWDGVLIITKKQNCENEAKRLIALTDWSVLPDVKINNKSEFENYRTILRNYILNPVENPIFPEEPNPIWIQPDIIIGENNG